MQDHAQYNPPVHSGLDILYQDQYFIAVNKPPGLLSVPGRGSDKSDCMISRVQLEYPDALVVHRLDMATSGILLFALDKQSQRIMSECFASREITKEYLARVSGRVVIEKDTISQPLIADWPNRPKQKIDYKQGKPSLTRYERIAIDSDGNSTVRLYPVTGRSHQLRVHLSSIGNPILGDELYGTFASRNASNRLLLHATRLSFIHPYNREAVDIQCPAEFS